MKKITRHNYDRLQTIRRVATFRSEGSCFLTGVSNRYESKLPESLTDMLTNKQLAKFSSYYSRLNQKVSQYWPCACAYYCGHFMCVFTAGLSMCIPYICVKEVEEVLKKQIKKINADILKDKKLEMRLVKSCMKSQLIIEEIDFNEFEI